MAPKRKRSAAEAGTDGEPTPEKPEKATKKAPTPKRDKNKPIPRSATPRGAPLAEGTRLLRLLTLNVAGLRAVLNNDEKAETLRGIVEREAPDVLCLNEHKLQEKDVEECEAKLKELLPKGYATMHWACSTAKKGYSGVAVLLRHPSAQAAGALTALADATVLKGMAELGRGDAIIEEEGRLLTLELPELSVVAVYVPNSGLDLGRLAYRTDAAAECCWDRTMAQYVQELQRRRGLPVIVIGDLNCCHRVQDIWNMSDRPDYPEGLTAKPLAEQYLGLSALKKAAGLTSEERASFGQMLSDGGLVDTFRALHPEASGVYSYFSQRVVQNRPLNRGLRLDYVLATADLCGGLAPRRPEEPAVEAKDDTNKTELPVLPFVHDSFILDQDHLVADHAPVGCHVALPALPAA